MASLDSLGLAGISEEVAHLAPVNLFPATSEVRLSQVSLYTFMEECVEQGPNHMQPPEIPTDLGPERKEAVYRTEKRPSCASHICD